MLVVNSGKEKGLETIRVESSGLRISAVFHRPIPGTFPVVICCHGLLSHKDSEKYRAIAEALVEQDIGVVRFDFRGCGESEGELSKSHVSARLEDLRNVMRSVRKIDGFNGKTGLVGSSLGGFLSILAACESVSEIPLVLWSTPVYLKPLSSRLRGSSALPFVPTEEYLRDLGKYRPEDNLDKLRAVLILHGTMDDLVSVSSAFTIFSGVNPPKELHVLNDADHRFTDSRAREFGIKATCRWFRRYLF